MTIENTVSSDIYPRSSIVKSVFDCRISCVRKLCSEQAVITGEHTGVVAAKEQNPETKRWDDPFESHSERRYFDI